jgi:glycosyltransferase involved in cell wall biosynthesis
MVGAIASGKRREPSGRSISAITPRRICRLETPNCWFDGFQGGAEKVKLICANCDEARPWRATESFSRGQSFETAVLEGEFRAARIFAYPSLATRGETFGLAPLEAMTHGCAVLVSDLGCFRDFISPNETAVVFEGGAPDPANSLVVAFRDALSDPVRLQRIARAGQLKPEEFSRARVADKFLIDFEKLISDAERTSR